jgi:hypothetical protein
VNKYTIHNRTIVDSIPLGREHLVIAKEINNQVSETQLVTRYYVKLINNKLVNPAGLSAFEMRKNEGKFVEVKKEVYDKYHNIINGKSRVSLMSLEGIM